MVKDDIQKMLRILINGQSKIREDISLFKKEVDSRFNKVDLKIDELENKLTERIDKIGLQLARLEDDTPTLDEFDSLKQQFLHHIHP